MAGQCQQETEQQQEQIGDDRLTKSLLHRMAPISNALFRFLAINIIIGSV
jgi:hypothetical protein